MSPAAFHDTNVRWNAVRVRDPRADGLFVYGVCTTMIYCRPVCKARLARRANVVFFDSASEAERANYRSCKRCSPGTTGTTPESDAVRRVRATIALWSARGFSATDKGECVVTEADSLEQMAKHAGLSKWHFHRLFKAVTQMTPMRFMRQQRNAMLPCAPEAPEEVTASEVAETQMEIVPSALSWPTLDVEGYAESALDVEPDFDPLNNALDCDLLDILSWTPPSKPNRKTNVEYL